MKTVLLTGGSSGIGKAIKQNLKNVGYEVFNMGRNKADIECDLEDLKEVEKKLKKWLKNHEVDVLINCAGMGIFKPHEELNSAQIQNLTSINLTAPILITNLCLRSLKKTKGHIFNITSIEATRHSKFSALYTATKSGLRAFSLTLFEELRKSEVKVTSLNPDMTKTAFFDNLSFEPTEEEGTYLEPQNIAKTLLFVLENRASVTDLTIRAPKFGIKKKQRNKE
jgi:short-subunit dehydrogenase